MTPERWQQIKALFDEALERDPDTRAAFIAQHGAGDDELRCEVHSLLAALSDERGRFEKPAVELAPDLGREEDRAALIGQHVGPYLLTREVGWGGMGTVYEAVRADEQYRKRVAVKLIRRGMDSSLVVRRFRHERQILAGLDHPNIAGLLDGGVTDDGRPWFAMEYVEGEPIDEYCSVRDLPVRERLALFLDVCSAMQYAHRNLVVHRDLKPRNILVTASGQPKLLDFGIAKLLDKGDGQGATQLTRAGDHLLTPEYAAPEQMRGEPLTTASDVYSLGVVLYELLTGQCPHRLEGRPLHEVVRTITEDQPARPSAVVTGAGAESKKDVGPLRRLLAGELDSIVMMAIRKEPERRYASVEQFRDDVQRYLEGRPVLAQADSALYRARKFVRRHAAGVAAATLVLLTLAGGVMATLSQAQRADAARQRAEARFDDVRELANVLLFEVHDAIDDLPGATEARALLVRRGVEYLDLLSGQRADDSELDRELAAAYIRLGRIQGTPTGANLGDLAGARESYARALSIAERLLATDSGDRAALRTLALAHEKLASVESWFGDVALGVKHARDAFGHWRALAEGRSENASDLLPVAISHINLGDLLGHPSFPNIGDRAGAMEQYRRSLTLLESLQPGQEQEDTAWTIRRYIGLVHERIGAMHLLDHRHDDALTSFNASFAIRQVLVVEDPENMDALRDAGIAHEKICSVYLAQRDAAAALPRCRQALEVYRQLRAADPQDAHSLRTLAIGHRWVHRALAAGGDLPAALEELEQSTALFRELLDSNGENVAARRNFAENLLSLSVLHARLSNEADGSASRLQEHRRRSTSYYRQGLGVLQALREEGTDIAADDDLLEDARARLGLRTALP